MFHRIKFLFDNVLFAARSNIWIKEVKSMLVDVFTAFVIVSAVVILCLLGIHLCRHLPEWSES